MSEQPTVKVGQVWADNDARSKGRTLQVVEVGPVQAVCEVLTVARYVSARQIGKTTRISLRRFRPNATGYRLISEPTL
jgi:hypothetical protein